MHSLIKSLIYISNMIKLKRDFVDVPYSVLIQNCLNILLNEGYILGFHRITLKNFRVFLKYYKGKSVINQIKWISTSGFRQYIDIKSLFTKYSLSDLVILSTPAGIMSNVDLWRYKNGLLKKKIKSDNLFKLNKYHSSFFNKEVEFFNIDHPLLFTLNFNNWNLYSLSNIFFHKNVVLKSFFRNKGIISQLSKRQYFRNKKLRLFFKKYYSDMFLKKKLKLDSNFLSDSLKNLYFFKFKSYFSSFRYIKFNKEENFIQFILKSNKIKIFSTFYFLFYLKQFSFSRYKFRFSLYLKYINHLLLFKNLNKKLVNNSHFDKKVNGGELLFIIR